MAELLQTLVAAVLLGSVYALIALGYTMVYGILRFINFAHGDMVVLGAWLSYTLGQHALPRAGVDLQNVPWWAGGLVLALTMAICAAVGLVVERLAYRPLRRAPRINVLIAAIGVSLFLQNAGQLNYVFGTQPQRMPELLRDSTLIDVPLVGRDGNLQHVVIGTIGVTIVATAAVLLVGLRLLVFHTRLGTAMRAVSYNTETAALMGINVDRVIAVTFMIGTALAAAAGFLYSMRYPSLSQPANAQWVLLGLKAFVAAVVGGIGNVTGAVAGGFVIAAIEQFGAYGLSSNLRDVYVFATLILVLLVRPTGLFGSPIPEKV